MVAAERWELPNLPRGGDTKYGYVSEWRGFRWILVANGPGPELAGIAADEFKGKVDALVSTGLCGGLDPALEIGDIFVAMSVNGKPALPPQTSRPFRTGELISQNRVAVTVDEKAALRAAGASAVEMEAEAMSLRAARWQVPFYCVRAVSDGAGEGFPLDLNAVRDKSGRFSTVRILAHALRNPGKLLPELLRLKRNSELAARNLGEFVADCRF